MLLVLSAMISGCMADPFCGGMVCEERGCADFGDCPLAPLICGRSMSMLFDGARAVSGVASAMTTRPKEGCVYKEGRCESVKW
jgi:hypothetical protein